MGLRHRLAAMLSVALSLALFAVLVAHAGPALAAEPPDADALEAKALARASDAVIGVEVQAVEGARSAETLGERRRGSGVVVSSDGLVLTIGYLILEAEQIDLVLDDQRHVPARVIAYDQATGFGLVQALIPLPVEAVPLGTAQDVADNDPLLFASGGQGGSLSVARLQSRRDFAGYWEYLIEGALFTSPARPDHSGAGLFNKRGELIGIGSLLVMDAKGEGRRTPGNMFVPIDLLKPILGELRERGASRASARAWLGVNCTEANGHVRVVRVSRDSPAEAAGLQAGDEIVGIDGVAISALDMLWRTLWKGGTPERDVRLEVLRDDERRAITVRSTDRMQTLQRARGI